MNSKQLIRKQLAEWRLQIIREVWANFLTVSGPRPKLWFDGIWSLLMDAELKGNQGYLNALYCGEDD